MAKKAFRLKADASVVQSTEELMASLGVGPGDWDVLLVGDGSGTGWGAAFGWACVLVDRRTGLRKDLHGGMSSGTSYLAEMLPYVHALCWYLDGPGRAVLADRLKCGPTAKLRAHVVTDSEIITRQASGEAGKKKGRPYWAMLDALEGEGVTITWHWVGRSQLGLNLLCDYMAGLCRRSVEAVGGVGPPPGATIYDFNPDPLRIADGGSET